MTDGLLINPYRFTSAPAFNPLTTLTWHTAFWADDPGWSNPGNGNAVATWSDGSGNGRDATEATDKPLFRSAYAGLNSKGGVDFDGTNDRLTTASFTAVTQPFSIVLVACNESITDNAYLISWSAGGMRTVTGTNRYGIYNGQVFTSTHVADTSAHFLHAKLQSGSDILGKDGSEQTGSAGLLTATQIGLGHYFSGGATAFSDVVIGFAGLYAGNITTDGAWATLKAGFATYYGLTIA